MDTTVSFELLQLGGGGPQNTENSFGINDVKRNPNPVFNLNSTVVLTFHTNQVLNISKM